MPPQGRMPVEDDTPPAPTLTSSPVLHRSGSESDMSEAESSRGGKRNHNYYRVRRSTLIGMVDWIHVLGTHAPYFVIIGIGILVAQIFHQILNDVVYSDPDVSTIDMIYAFGAKTHHLGNAIYQIIVVDILHGNLSAIFALLSPAVKITGVILFVLGWLIQRDHPIYLLSFATWKAPASWRCSHEEIIKIMRNQGCFTEKSIEFLQKILERSGTGQTTAWPPGITKCLDIKPEDVGKIHSDRSIQTSREEAETIIFDVVRDALAKANCSPKDIDVLIINCSLFSPTPSLCAMVLSHFNMRSDVATYNLSGMGCSASLISIDLAKKLLCGTHSTAKKALVVSTEILTPNFYHGNDRGFLIQNTLFRCGGAAIVLSNNWWDGRRAWYKLLHTVRVQGTGAEAYECVYETEDDLGERGVRLSKDIVKVAGKCMEKNLTTLGPYILPIGEQLKVVFSVVARFILKSIAKNAPSFKTKLPIVKPYVPDFKRGIDHFCIHAGGRAVIDGIEKNMKLEKYHSEASRMTLLNYGNTSSSSIWYELEYIQETQESNPMKKGDRIMQVAFGSGFKCTSGVWLKL